MLNFKQYSTFERVVLSEDDPRFTQEHNVQYTLFEIPDYLLYSEDILAESVEDHPDNPKKIIFRHDGGTPNPVKSIAVPKHMWYGGKKSIGMQKRNAMRAQVYGSENRNPLGIGQVEQIHKEHLAQHFAKPKPDQIRAEKEAIERLHRAGHLQSGDTLDKGEKTDTVEHEHDEQGRSFRAASSKGVAGHAVYTSGFGPNEKHHIINTCPGQTSGCGGGITPEGHCDTSKGTCFAPKAEAQYVDAAVRRAAHEQAKHDPAMTRDWVLAHVHSLRRHAGMADKENRRFLFRPNVVDETDKTSRHVLTHLNKQRQQEGLPPIIANSYSKTNSLHDPENNFFVTHSNIGPKVKNGKEIGENRKRDNLRIRNTIHAVDTNGNDLKNEQGNMTPPRGSYMVLNAHRGSDIDKAFQKHVTHTKYWNAGREAHELTPEEQKEGPEGHFNGEGQPTSPEQSHYGHITITGKDGKKRRYDYQKQHVLHPRMVDIGADKDHPEGHVIPTDSRFMDDAFLPKGPERFKSKNGKTPGGILITTPTTSTSNAQHNSSFTHHIDDNTIEHAKQHNGEYEIDNPYDQEAARGNEFNQAPLVTTIAPAPKANDPFAALPVRQQRAAKAKAAKI